MINLAFFLLLFRILTLAILPGVVGMLNISIFVACTSFTVIWIVVRSDYLCLRKYLLYEICLLLFLAISVLISGLNELVIADSVEYFLKYLIVISCLNIGLICGVSELKNFYFKLIYYSLFLHVILGIVLLKVGFVHEVHGVERITGISGGVQIYANLISILFVLSYFLSFYKVDLIPKSILLFAIFVSILAFGLSNTLKNFAVSIIIMTLPYFLNKTKFFKFTLAFFIIIVPLTLVLWPYIKELSLFERLQTTYSAGLSTQLAPGEKLESSLIWRFIHWKLLISDWIKNYFWFGSGLGQTVNMNALVTANGNGFEAHSDIITFIVEFGLVFTPLIAALLMYPLFDCYKSFRRSGDVLPICILFMALSSFIASFFGNVFYSLANIYYLWFFVGWVLGKNEN